MGRVLALVALAVGSGRFQSKLDRARAAPRMGADLLGVVWEARRHVQVVWEMFEVLADMSVISP